MVFILTKQKEEIYFIETMLQTLETSQYITPKSSAKTVK